MTKPDQIFISYSSKDADFVSRLASSLEHAGISAWVDRKAIRGGDRWMDVLANAMVGSSAVVLVISPDSVKSPWVMKEISFAARRGMQVIPVIYRNTEIPALFDFSIGGLQRIDFTEGAFQDAMMSLTGAIQKQEQQTPRQIERAAALNFQIYVEDIWEFAQQVPARMYWRFGRLNGLSVFESFSRAIVFATPGFLPCVIFNLVIISIIAVVMNLIFPVPHNVLEDVFIVIGLAIFAGALQGLAGVFLRRYMKRQVPKVYPDLKYRPHAETPNRLLDRWHESVKPIIWQLADEPSPQWSDYLDKRIGDDELASRVVMSLVLLVSMTAPE